VSVPQNSARYTPCSRVAPLFHFDNRDTPYFVRNLSIFFWHSRTMKCTHVRACTDTNFHKLMKWTRRCDSLSCKSRALSWKLEKWSVVVVVIGFDLPQLEGSWQILFVTRQNEVYCMLLCNKWGFKEQTNRQ